MKKQSNRLEIRVPDSFLERIDKFKEDMGHTTRSSAVLELIRESLEQHEKTK